MTIILTPFATLLGGLYSVTGSYGLSIILFGLLFKILLFPISMKGRKSMLDMSRLSDKQKELQAKFGRDRQRYSEELQKLYAAEKVKPSGGCLWSLLPLPVLMALFFIISQPFTYLMGLSAKGDNNQVKQLTDFILGDAAAAPLGGRQLGFAQDVFDRFGEVQAALPEIAAQISANGGPIDFRMWGINLSSVPSLNFWEGGITWGSLGLFLIPILSAAFAFLSMYVSMGINKRVLGKATSQDKTNRQMMFLQPVISLWIGFTLPAALGLYWTANGIFAIAQDFCSIGILRKHVEKNREAAEKRAIEQKEEERERKRRESETKKQKAEEARRIKMERKLSTDGISESRVGMRAYAKGRTYDNDRHPVTEYHDPDDIIREQRAERAAAAEAKQTAVKGKPQKKEKPPKKEKKAKPGRDDLN